MIRYSFLFFVILLFDMSCTPPSSSQAQSSSQPKYAIAIHGGAGTINRSKLSPEKEKAYRATLDEALAAGEQVLASGGSSLDAVQAAIIVMENSPLFNAGKGAVFTYEKQAELDASFMEGATLNAGAIAGARHVKNPILAARGVMENSIHVMLSGAGADQFAEELGVEMVPNEYFHTERRLKQLEEIQANSDEHQTALDHSEPLKKKYGTVGAVALDMQGNLAAGTSTGGMTNKRYGRIGDAPIIGAGTYANNESCAISCTGHGEFFMRNVVAFDVSARMRYQNKTLQQAADEVVFEVLKPQEGGGGLIAVDKAGNIHMPFNTSGMYRASRDASGKRVIAIYEPE